MPNLIVGAISASGGMATHGGIFERGSNANGEYTRFADGTQICVSPDFSGIDVTSAVGSIFRNASPVAWTFPAAFASVGTIGGSVASQANSQTHWGVLRFTGASAADITVFAPGSTSGRTVRAMAIGRWF